MEKGKEEMDEEIDKNFEIIAEEKNENQVKEAKFEEELKSEINEEEDTRLFK